MNIIYTKFLEQVQRGLVDLDAAGTVLRFLLVRDTSTYTPNKDHDFVSDLTGLVEITAAGYSRVNAANKAVNIDDANDRTEFDFDDLSFGTPAAGQSAEAIIGYIQVGGDDSTPGDDILVCYIDTATGLPATLGGGEFLATVNAEGFIQQAQA